jgi:hypothetical protein
VNVNTGTILVNTGAAMARVGFTGAYGDLSGRPTLGTAAAASTSDFAPAAQGVTNGNSHDHNGGDGAQIAYGSLSGLPTLGTAAAQNVGAGAGNVVQLDNAAKLPAVDGSQLTNLPVAAATDLTYDAASREVRSSTGTDATLPLVSTSSAGLQPATGFGTITYSATVNLDLAARDGQVATITLTDSLELTTSNLANGRSTGLRLIPGASSRTLTFPTDWVFVSAKPASIPANKVARLTIECHGTTNADVVAAIAIQP